MTNVLIVDDERLVREVFSGYIESVSNRYRLVDAISVAAYAKAHCVGGGVDLVLMDVCTAHNSSGLEAAAEIKKSFPEIKVIIVTSAPEYRFIEKAKAANADSFCYKDSTKNELIDIMDRTVAGEHIYPESTPSVEVGLAESGDFTKRELEILLHLANGEATKEIAEALNINITTAKWHIKNLMEKTNCTTRTQLAVLASKTRLVLPEY